MKRPWGIRSRLFVAVAVITLVTLALLLAGVNVVLRRSLDRDASALAERSAVAVLPTLDTSAGHVDTGEAPDEAAVDAAVWVYDGPRLIEAPELSSRLLDAAAARLAAAAPRTETVAAGVRMAAVPVTDGGRRLGAVVAAVSLEPYDASKRRALAASAALALATLVAMLALAAWILRRALTPVSEMTLQAARWSVDEPERRFARGPAHDELTSLAATLDQLLERLNASLRREQRFSAELAHELRTPLARIAAECELTARRDGLGEDVGASLGEIRRSAIEMSATIDTLLASARNAASGRRGSCLLPEVAGDLASRLGSSAADRSVALTVGPDGAEPRVAVEHDLAVRIAAPVVENAIRHARSRVQLRVDNGDRVGRITIEDDGAGVPPDESERIFEPGVRGPSSTGAGLGLALAQRLAREAGGSIRVEHPAAGARFVIELPLA